MSLIFSMNINCVLFSVLCPLFVLVMIEASADNILQSDFLKAIRSGLKETQAIIQQLEKLARKYGKDKRIPDKLFVPREEVVDEVRR